MKKITFLALYFVLLVPGFVLGQSNSGSGQTVPGATGGAGQTVPSGSGGIKIPNPLEGTSTIAALFKTLLEILLIFAVPIVVFFIILAGFKYVTASGNTTKVEEAHRALLYAVIGGVLILGASVLIDVIQGTVDAVKK